MDSLKSIINAIDVYFDKYQIDDENPEGYPQCTEHELITHFCERQIEPFDQLDIRQRKDLFCAHFLTRHALYQLQNQYFEQKSYRLSIEITKIERLPYSSGPDSLASHDPLKTYYLDISHYFETSEEEINTLLNGFWQKYLAQDDKQQALSVLELPADADYPTIKKQYRTLAQKTHPDKGGCSKQIAKISAAKTILDKFFL